MFSLSWPDEERRTCRMQIKQLVILKNDFQLVNVIMRTVHFLQTIINFELFKLFIVHIFPSQKYNDNFDNSS